MYTYICIFLLRNYTLLSQPCAVIPAQNLRAEDFNSPRLRRTRTYVFFVPHAITRAIVAVCSLISGFDATGEIAPSRFEISVSRSTGFVGSCLI